MEPASNRYIAYADGSCLGNPGPGGWGVVLISPDGARRELNGHADATTNNRMEIEAAVRALREIPDGAPAIIRSDSLYLVNTINKGWKRNANADSWSALEREIARRPVAFEWVRGHNGDPLNDRADELAVMGAKGRMAESAAQEAADDPIALRAGERVARCVRCGRDFVSSNPNDEFCPMVECRRAIRRGR